jgi:hypothetical protein
MMTDIFVFMVGGILPQPVSGLRLLGFALPLSPV